MAFLRTYVALEELETAENTNSEKLDNAKNFPSSNKLMVSNDLRMKKWDYGVDIRKHT